MSLLRKFIPGNKINNVLYKAIYSNDIETVTSVIDDVGISFCPLWAEGYDLLITALECKHFDIAMLLVKKGCSIDRIQNGISDTPKSVIHLAVRQGDINLLSLLLDRDLDSLKKFENGDSLLHVAISEGQREILEILLDRGIDLECRSAGGMTPLHLAALRGKLDILEQLLIAGACLESQDINGKTSLFLGVSSGHRHVVKKLLELGANCKCKSKSGQTPLLDATNKGYIEIVKDLLDFDADLSDKNSFGQTPLHIACMQKNKVLISVLLNAGADVNAFDCNGLVPCDAIVKKVSTRTMYFENSSVSYLLGKHLTILKVGGFYLNKKNQIFYDLFYEMYCNEIVVGNSVLSAPSDVLHSIVKMCEDQIILMKNTSDRGITVYNTFNKLKSPLILLSRNEIDFLTSINLKDNFSLYEPLIKHLLKLGKLRNNLLERAQEGFSFIISLSGSELPALPEEMVSQILNHLTNDELNHLVQISHQLQLYKSWKGYSWKSDMVHEVLSFHFGQCGNSIGLQYWQNLSKEHGIDPKGQLSSEDLLQSVDNKNSFFHECPSGRFIPRCIMVDLEPRVIQSIKNSDYNQLFDPHNMFGGEDGGGAGNNWASGYNRAKKCGEELLELIRRETEAMELFEGSIISHAISGGTGAGLGSYILEQLTDDYPKKTVQTYSVFPSLAKYFTKGEDETGVSEGQYNDVVVQPYNSLLTLLRLASYADSVIVLDNLALHNLSPDKFFPRCPSFVNINKIVSNVMTASLAPIRYPRSMFNCLSDITISLTPMPKLHFLMTGYTPLRPCDSQAPVNQIMKTSVVSVMRRLGKIRNMMVSLYHPMDSAHGYISVFNVIQGNNLSDSATLVSETISQFKQKVHYLPWVEPIYQAAFCPWSPYQVRPNHISGLTMTNHSAIVNYFQSTLSQFGKLYSRMAYVDLLQSHSGYDNLKEELESCKHSCENLISEYTIALGSNYPTEPNKN